MPEGARSATADLASFIPVVADFPEPGVAFRDITPLVGSAEALAAAVEALAGICPTGVDLVLAIEARGFVFGAPVALALGAGLVLVRKPAKLPREVVTVSYELEYGTETLAVHADAMVAGARVVLVDDVLATGGTAVAAAGLVHRLGGELAGVRVLAELDYLGGRDRLAAAGLTDVASVLTLGPA